jgi:hypothetical protein
LRLARDSFPARGFDVGCYQSEQSVDGERPLHDPRALREQVPESAPRLLGEPFLQWTAARFPFSILSFSSRFAASRVLVQARDAVLSARSSACARIKYRIDGGSWPS